ncbi:uncharacterized protein PF11_0207-like [Helianthus annuus]|uniref:uncharacterized protein PF11_0207-like n=1 Tax=Helianthus annuus TaxID=4232 RepID=UPI000B9079D3|nr:uncharacterized protein PF11_0207-like [Helianthus annuus]
MTSCLRKRDEERMTKIVEEMVNNLKKAAEEVKDEAVEVEVVKKVEVVKEEDLKVAEKEKIKEKNEVNVEVEKAVTEEQQVVEDEKKIESLVEEKNEILEIASDAGDKGLNKTKDCENGSWSSLAQREEEKVVGPYVG